MPGSPFPETVTEMLNSVHASYGKCVHGLRCHGDLAPDGSVSSSIIMDGQGVFLCLPSEQPGWPTPARRVFVCGDLVDVWLEVQLYAFR